MMYDVGEKVLLNKPVECCFYSIEGFVNTFFLPHVIF